MSTVQINIIRRHLVALGAPLYLVTLRRSATGRACTLGEHHAAEFTAGPLLARLRARNAQGECIYITPHSPGHHYILIDDLDRAGLDRLMDGFRPASVCESSPGNFQAVLVAAREPASTSKADQAQEQSVANAVMIFLNRHYDGDPKISAARHPFRLAGLTNRKAKYQQQNGLFPFVRLVQADGGQCDRLADLLAAERARRAALAPEARPYAHQQIDDDDAGLARPTCSAALAKRYADEFERQRLLALRLGWSVNESIVDWRATLVLLNEGHDPGDIEAALAVASPNLARRHRYQGGADYARRTVAKASRNRAAKAALSSRSASGAAARAVLSPTGEDEDAIEEVEMEGGAE